MPDRSVSPNARRGESRLAAIMKSRTVKSHRRAATHAMKIVLARGDWPAGSTALGYSLAHYFPTLRFRDEDNADGACKAYRDGICDALGIDDRNFCKLRLSTRAKDKARPRVDITIYFETKQATV